MMTVACPSCGASYRLKERPEGGGTLTCKRCGTRFAVPEDSGPPPRGAAHAGGEGGAARRHHRPSGTPTGLVIGLIVVLAGAAIVGMLVLATREKAPTYAELKTQLGIVPGGGQVEMDETEFMQRMGEFDRNTTMSIYVYFYRRVQEGEAEIVLDRGAWENGRARILQITLR